jgi:hypothetical protein
VAFLFSAIRALSIQHSAFSQGKRFSKSPAGGAGVHKDQTFFFITGKSAGATKPDPSAHSRAKTARAWSPFLFIGAKT